MISTCPGTSARTVVPILRFAKLSVMTACISAGAAFGNTISGLYYTSSPGSSIGHGETLTVDASEASVFDVEQALTATAIDVAIFGPSSTNTRTWLLAFAAPFGQLFQIEPYAAATEFPFEAPGVPGMYVSIDGSDTSRILGYFSVLEVGFSNGIYSSFAVDFLQFDDRSESQWIRGSFRYNSDIPFTAQVDEPASLILMAFGVWAMFVILPHGRRARVRSTVG
jgi:hypothetical protein